MIEPTYGFRCAYCDADLETGVVDADAAAKIAQEKGWRITFGFSTRWGSGAHNTCPDCLPVPGSNATLARALEIREGQIWRRDEKRFRGRRRYIRVQFICIGGLRVRVQGCKINGAIPAGAKSTEVDISRFNRRGGFLPVVGS